MSSKNDYVGTLVIQSGKNSNDTNASNKIIRTDPSDIWTFY